MPGLSQLKKFSSDLLALGDETNLRAARGEKPVKIEIPKDVEDKNDSEASTNSLFFSTLTISTSESSSFTGEPQYSQMHILLPKGIITGAPHEGQINETIAIPIHLLPDAIHIPTCYRICELEQ